MHGWMNWHKLSNSLILSVKSKVNRLGILAVQRGKKRKTCFLKILSHKIPVLARNENYRSLTALNFLTIWYWFWFLIYLKLVKAVAALTLLSAGGIFTDFGLFLLEGRVLHKGEWVEKFLGALLEARTIKRSNFQDEITHPCQLRG